MQRFLDAVGQFGPAEWFSLGAMIVALFGACVASFAARIEVQDNVDRFIAELARQSKWNGIAAAVNVIAGALIFISAAPCAGLGRLKAGDEAGESERHIGRRPSSLLLESAVGSVAFDRSAD